MLRSCSLSCANCCLSWCEWIQQIFSRFFFILSLATLLCQSWCSKLIYREICVKRSAMGNKEMSALKYGIIYCAKIDRLIASRHINTLSFLNNKLGNKFWKHACVQRCLWGEGRGRVCVNWKTPQKFKSIPTFVHDCSLPSSSLLYYAQF